jgi:hypothetical protein
MLRRLVVDPIDRALSEEDQPVAIGDRLEDMGPSVPFFFPLKPSGESDASA